jgi:predicted metal-dependent TIM-barrel fold hydrolase
MSPDRGYPTKYPTGPITDEEVGVSEKASAIEAQIPWIDGHIHEQTLSLNERQQFDREGAVATVMIAYTPHYVPYRPVHPEHVQFLWDDAIKRCLDFNRIHFHDTHISIGLHVHSHVENYHEVLETMPEYLELDEVVAVGETGIDPVQATSQWPLEEQEEVIQRQMELAREHDLPLILHTPSSKTKGSKETMTRSKVEEGHVPTEPQLDPETAKLEATKIDLELKERARLPDEQLIVDHSDADNLEYVIENTDCYVSFSIGANWLRGITPEFLADAIDEYGSDRLMIDSDLAGCLYGDMCAIKQMIVELLRRGVDVEDVRNVVYENQKEVFGFEYP